MWLPLVALYERVNGLFMFNKARTIMWKKTECVECYNKKVYLCEYVLST